MEDDKIYYHRNLPHYQPSHATYFITFRLTGSLPNEVIIKLKEEYELVEKHLETIINPYNKKKELDEHRKQYFKKV